MIIEEVQKLLQQATYKSLDVSDELIEWFGERCKDVIRKQLNTNPDRNIMRLSQLSRPLCQLQMQNNGVEGEQSDYAFKMTMITGDMLEAVILLMLKHQYGDRVKHDIPTLYNGKPGTADLLFDDEYVYDVKSCSGWSYDNKFYSFQTLNEKDSFGYVGQVCGYADGLQKKVGGFIAINKNKGTFKEIIVPQGTSKEHLKKIDENIDKLENKAPFKRCFSPVPETYYNKPTGKSTLAIECEYCQFKGPCWGDKIEFVSNPKLRSDKKKWYFK